MTTNPETSDRQQRTKMDGCVNKVLAPVAFIGGLLLIFFVTLNTLSFDFYPLSTGAYLAGFAFFPSSYLDFPLNMLLFLPFGFGLASLLEQARLSRRAVFVLVLLAGLLVTWLVESLQTFLPGRTPNVADILANTLGALLGLGLYRIWQNRRSFRTTILKPQWLVLCLLFYLFILSAVGLILHERARLDNWRPRLSMMIGNESSGDRPWSGTVKDLAFLDQALPETQIPAYFAGGSIPELAAGSLAAYYPLHDAADLADQTGNNHILVWKTAAEQPGAPADPQLDGQHWLQSRWAVIDLGERLMAASQFTVMVTAAAADAQQTGPARIVSISATPFYRNLTLGQEGQDLIVRVRTPQTGQNGTIPELAAPAVFADQEAHQLIVTYDGRAVHVYVDEVGTVHTFEFLPGLAFFHSLYAPFRRTLTVSPTSSSVYQVLFYALAFLPVGFLLLLIALQIRSLLARALFLLLGIIVPPLLLELALTAGSVQHLRLPNALLAAAVIALSYLLLTPFARRLLRPI